MQCPKDYERHLYNPDSFKPYQFGKRVAAHNGQYIISSASGGQFISK